MRLSPPRRVTFLLSVILVALGFLGMRVNVPVLSELSPFFVLAGYLVLACGNLLTGL